MSISSFSFFFSFFHSPSLSFFLKRQMEKKYAPKIALLKYINQNLVNIKGWSKIIQSVGDFSTPLPSMDRFFSDSVSTRNHDLKITQLNSIDIFRAFCPKAAEYNFFSNAHETFFSIDYMVEHKRSPINVTLKSCKASSPATMASELTWIIRKNNITNTHTNTWRLNSNLLKWVP